MKLNAKILTLTLFGFLFSNLYSQENKDPEVKFQKDTPSFRLGLHFSPNLSWFGLNTTGYEKDGSRMGFAYGISTEFFLAKNYLFSTGFSINNVGGKMKYEGVYENLGVSVASSVKQSIKVNFIDIPLMLKMRTNEIGYMTYYGKFGFIAGIKYNSKSNYEYVDQNSIKQTDVNNSSNISFFNMNLVVGGGAEYNLSGNTNIMFGISYHNGFIDISKSKTHEINALGKAAIGADGKPVYTDKGVSATLNYFSLDLGIYF